MALSKYDLSVLSHGMSEMAASHKNDMISNALSRVSQKLESLGTPFARKLTEEDKAVIVYYHTEKKKMG